MFPGNAEAVARERHRVLLWEAEQRRLIKAFEAGHVSQSTRLQRIIPWLGGQLVTLGLKLQGQSLPPAQVVNTLHLTNDTNCSSP